MKDLKHIKRFNESDENLNISDVSNRFDSDTYDTVFSLDVSFIIDYLLEDLKLYCNDNNIILTKTEIQKIIDNFKKNFDPRNEGYYSEGDHYESLSDNYSDEFFKKIIDNVK